jgi:hypothetical protein
MFIIGSYHKTGTVLLSNIFEKLNQIEKKKLNYIFYENFGSCTDNEIKHHKSVVIIRNPYEMICSGVRYHQISSESWLNEKKDFYENKSYREKLLMLDDDDKILFEMNNCAKYNIGLMYNDIKNRNYNDNILFIKLEDLIDNNKLPELCKKIIKHLNEEFAYDNFIQACLTCLNLGLNHRTHFDNTYTYIQNFKNIHYEEFDKLFPSDLLGKFGYIK